MSQPNAINNRQITTELRHPAISFIRHVNLFTNNAVKTYRGIKMASPSFLSRPQRETYANETPKQTLLQAKCVTYTKNKLNNKGNR